MSLSRVPRILVLRKHSLRCWKQQFTVNATLSYPTEEEGRIVKILENRLSASSVTVEDMSGGCGQAYSITIESESFRGKKILQQHQLVNDALKDVISSIHAITIHTSVPSK